MRTCTICSHPKRSQIETALAAGESLRNIAQKFSTVSIWAIRRHKEQHIKPALQLLQRERSKEGALSVLERLERSASLIDEALAEVWNDQHKDVDQLLKVLAEERQLNRLYWEWQRDTELARLTSQVAEMEQQIGSLLARRGG